MRRRLLALMILLLPVGAAAEGVHLESYRTEAAAQKGWSQLAKRHRDLLQGLDPHYVRTVVPKKGTFWRIIAGPVDHARAVAMCAAFAKVSHYCKPVPFEGEGPPAAAGAEPPPSPEMVLGKWARTPEACGTRFAVITPDHVTFTTRKGTENADETMRCRQDPLSNGILIHCEDGSTASFRIQSAGKLVLEWVQNAGNGAKQDANLPWIACGKANEP